MGGSRFLIRLLALVMVGGMASALLTACMGEVEQQVEPITLTLAGSTEMWPVMLALTNSYHERNPHVSFDLRRGGSSLGESWAATGQVDLATSALAYPDEELPPGLVRVPIALDGLTLVVHPNNPVNGLSMVQIRQIYGGRILDWAEVGGNPGEILLISREDGSGSRQLFEERVMGEERVSLTAIVMPTGEDVVRYVARQPQAVGYVGMAYGITLATAGDDPIPDGEGNLSTPLPQVKALNLEGYLPDVNSIAPQIYQLSRPLYLLHNNRNPADVQPFIDFILSPAGQSIVARYHVPIR
jgi:phosphate transport system substrate-binding protein